MSLAAAMSQQPASYSLGLHALRLRANSSRTSPKRSSFSGWLSPPIAMSSAGGSSRPTRTSIMRSLDMAKAPDATKPIRLLYSSLSAAASRAASCSALISSSVFSGSSAFGP